MTFTFANVCRILSVVLLIPLVWFAWGEPSFFGYVVAFLAGHTVGSLSFGNGRREVIGEDAKAAYDALDERERDDILEAVAQGRKIEAIKRTRTHTGLGLASAKQLVESLPRPAQT